jgi:hypothetical protein
MGDPLPHLLSLDLLRQRGYQKSKDYWYKEDVSPELNPEQEDHVTEKNRTDFLPEIGQRLMKALAAEAVSDIKKGSSPRSKCLQEILDLAAIPYEFSDRWNEERAIEDILRKARDYGFVRKNCRGSWTYVGPEVKKAEREKEKRRKEGEKKIIAYLKKLKLPVERNSVNCRSWGSKPGETTAVVILPKHLWLEP